MVLVLEQPVLAVLHQELVTTEARVDEAVDKRRGQVLACAVHVGAASEDGSDVVQMRLVNLVRTLGLHDVELSGQRQKVVVQVTIGVQVWSLTQFYSVGFLLSYDV